ncbi:MAG: class I SAM-dependent methyltransferase [Candidatus Hodarchaeota archaeon]
MSPTIHSVIDLGNLPFHVGVQATPSNEDLPDSLPFHVGLHLGMNLLVQIPNADVSKYLAKAYAKGSVVGTPMSEDCIGRSYAEDFLKFILKNVNLRNGESVSVLEIGCGTGYLLHRLQKLRFKVLGIEPGRQGQTGARKYGVDIIQDTFPGKMNQSRKRFEIIIHYGVLEHIEKPVVFLRRQAECLSESGLIIFAVPNCREYILSGDISMFLHEHWNYFTAYSLKKVLGKAGLELLRLEKAGYGGVLYGVAGKPGRAIDVPEDLDWSLRFKDCVQQFIEKMKAFFQKCVETKRSLGIFCPGRVINTLHLIRPANALHFFDDDESLHGKYYPPFDIPIESRRALIERPVDELVIMSSSFGEKLRGELCQVDALRNTNIRLIREILASNGT